MPTSWWSSVGSRLASAWGMTSRSATAVSSRDPAISSCPSRYPKSSWSTVRIHAAASISHSIGSATVPRNPFERTR